MGIYAGIVDAILSYSSNYIMMSSTGILVVVFLEAVIEVSAFTDWSYRNPDGQPSDWKELYPECGGQLQSPIDVANAYNIFIDLGVELTKGYRPAPDAMTLANDGDTVVLTGAGSPQRLQIDDGKIFELDNIHFHWGDKNDDGSEHALNGKRYALEMQAVHNRVNEDGSLVSPPESVIIVGLFKYRARARYSVLNQFIERLKDVVEPGSSVDIKPFLWSHYFALNRDWYRYEGSLTTPPCSEGVTYFVSGNTKLVNNTQLDYFRMLRGKDNETMAGNNRPLQKRNGRKILHSLGSGQ